jgi:allantoinase
MPLNSIPATTTLSAYEQKLDATQAKLHVDTGFWGGVVPGNTAELEPMWRAGVFGFKCFLVPSGVDEFSHVGEEELREAMPVLAKLGAPLLVHAESPDYLPLRPPESECDAIALMIRLSRETGTRVHIVHLAAIEALPLIEQAQAEGVPITVETCPHYVFFDHVPLENVFKCAPPVRGGLREALPRIGMVVTDHSPSPPELKSGPYETAWGGIASLELGLSAMATIHQNLSDLARWMSEAPAKLAGLDRKGRIAPGYDADLVLFDPETKWTVDPEKLHQRHKMTPYAGREMQGRVRATYLRGEKIYEEGNFVLKPCGTAMRCDQGRLQMINTWSAEHFLRCCGSRRWAESMAAAKPFASWRDLEQTTATIWNESSREDVLEAFAAHRKIGDYKGASEQDGVRTAQEATLSELAKLNEEYLARFGYIYVVCATGKSGDEMLALLRQRIHNDPAAELSIAKHEQQSITQIRLRKMNS